MKITFGLTLMLLVAVSCNKKENKTSGVCYCDFANGKTQEYNLTHLTRTQQVDTCYMHSNNAANFGGKCTLQ